MLSDLTAFGELIVNVIIWIADSVVTGRNMPGYIVAVILVAAFYYMARIYLRIRPIAGALKDFKNFLYSEDVTAGDPQSKERVAAYLNGLRSKTSDRLRKAWEGYAHTVYVDHSNEAAKAYASVSPAHYFNRALFQLPEGFWRVLPNLFVSFGLLMTFLGLIAALDKVDFGTGGDIRAGMEAFLSIASAKFIMSVGGLFSAILITLTTRLSLGGLDKRLHELNARLSELFPYRSLEELAQQQLKETRDQREHLQKLAYELAAEIARPLREELPQAISTAIDEKMRPVLEHVQAQGTEGVREMVGSLSSQITENVGQALSDASGRLELAAQRLSEVADALAANIQSMGQGLSEQARQLAESVAGVSQALGERNAEILNSLKDQAATLQTQTAAQMQRLMEGLQSQMQALAEQTRQQLDQTAGFMAEETRKILGESRESLIAPLQEMATQLTVQSTRLAEMLDKAGDTLHARAREGAEAVQAQLAAAGEGLKAQADAISGALRQTGEEIARETGEVARQMLQTAQAEVLPPLQELAGQLQQAAEATRTGANGLTEAARGLQSGAQAAQSASGAFRQSAEAVSESTGALKGALETFRRQNDEALQRFAEMARGVEQAARLLETSVQEARHALAAEQASLAHALEALQAAIDETADYRDDLMKLDEKAGQALEEYSRKVSETLATMSTRVREISEGLAQPLATLQEVVQQVEEFRPRQRREG